MTLLCLWKGKQHRKREQSRTDRWDTKRATGEVKKRRLSDRLGDNRVCHSWNLSLQKETLSFNRSRCYETRVGQFWKLNKATRLNKAQINIKALDLDFFLMVLLLLLKMKIVTNASVRFLGWSKPLWFPRSWQHLWQILTHLSIVLDHTDAQCAGAGWWINCCGDFHLKPFIAAVMNRSGGRDYVFLVLLSVIFLTILPENVCL